MPFVISGIGMGLFFAPVANVVLSAVRPSEEGQASGANNAIREVGGVFGVAVLASVFQRHGQLLLAAGIRRRPTARGAGRCPRSSRSGPWPRSPSRGPVRAGEQVAEPEQSRRAARAGVRHERPLIGIPEATSEA